MIFYFLLIILIRKAVCLESIGVCWTSVRLSSGVCWNFVGLSGGVWSFLVEFDCWFCDILADSPAGKSVGLTSPASMHQKVTRKSLDNSSHSRAKNSAFWIDWVQRNPTRVWLEKRGECKDLHFCNFNNLLKNAYFFSKQNFLNTYIYSPPTVKIWWGLNKLQVQGISIKSRYFLDLAEKCPTTQWYTYVLGISQ